MIKTTPSNGLRNDVLPNALFKVYDLQKKLKKCIKNKKCNKKIAIKIFGTEITTFHVVL